MMTLYFECQHESMPSPELLPSVDSIDGTQWAVAHEYGQVVDIQQVEKEVGVLLVKDMFL